MIVVTGDYGRLGNRLIVHANLIAAARAHGLRGMNLALREFAPLLHGTQRSLHCPFPDARGAGLLGAALARLAGGNGNGAARLIRRLARRLGRVPGARLLDIGWFGRCDLDGAEFLELARRPGLLLLKGWQFRASASFAVHAPAIRAALAPRESIRRCAARRVEAARREADVVVGVHVRQGDYRQFLDGRYCFELDVYRRWMHELVEQFSPRTVAFVLTSDARLPHDAFAGLHAAQANGDAIEDMHTLATCDCIIGPPSTFSAWASFAGQTPLSVMLDAHAHADPAVAERVSHFDERRRPTWLAPHAALTAERRAPLERLAPA